MSSTILPNEIIMLISQSLEDHLDWLHSVGTCKQWKEVLYPLYLETDFKVIFIEKRCCSPFMIKNREIYCKTFFSKLATYRNVSEYFISSHPKIINNHF